MEKKSALNKYDNAVAKGDLASVLTEQSDDMYTLLVGNIMPDEEVIVEITILCPLKFENGAYLFSVPLNYFPDSVENENIPINFTMNIHDAEKMSRIAHPKNS